MITFFCDGGVRGNPSTKGAWAFFVVFEDKNSHREICRDKVGALIGKEATNNVAEYMAVLEAVKYAKINNMREIIIKSDSNLVIQQLNKNFMVKNPGIAELYKQVVKEASGLQDVKFQWVPRTNIWIKQVDDFYNKIADMHGRENA